MSSYAIVETEVGLTVTELQNEAHPEDDALRCHGVLVDPGPYPSYEDAFDAIGRAADQVPLSHQPEAAEV